MYFSPAHRCVLATLSSGFREKTSKLRSCSKKFILKLGAHESTPDHKDLVTDGMTVLSWFSDINNLVDEPCFEISSFATLRTLEKVQNPVPCIFALKKIYSFCIGILLGNWMQGARGRPETTLLMPCKIKRYCSAGLYWITHGICCGVLTKRLKFIQKEYIAIVFCTSKYDLKFL